MTIGRRTKLTPQRQEKIIQAILAGNYFETACAYAGVSRDAGFEWIARGENRDPDRRGSAVFAAFASAVREAEAQAEVHAVAIVRQGFTDNPRLALDFLARRHPTRWGQQQTMTILRQMATEVEAMSDDELLAAVAGESGAAAEDSGAVDSGDGTPSGPAPGDAQPPA